MRSSHPCWLEVHRVRLADIFSSEEEAACITLWDIRARGAVYDLSTGNNAVAGMIWNDHKNELWAATTCEHRDGAGYRRARFPNPDWKGEGDEENDKYLDTDKRWPKQAYHHETYFGHAFDSAGDRMCELICELKLRSA